MAKGSAAVVAEGVMSVAEAVAFSRLSKAELYKAMAAGRLTFVKYGRRRLVPRKALVDLLAAGLSG